MSLEAFGLPPNAKEDDVRRVYRERVRLSHPDHGGTSEAFQALQAQRDAAMVEVHTPKACPACAGSGSKFIGSGFSRVKMLCEKCGGTGEGRK